MRNKNDLFTIWEIEDRLECKSWDKVDSFWIPTDNDTESVIYANKVVGKYELVLMIIGVGEEGCVTVKLMLSKHLSFDDTASSYLVHKKDLDQNTDLLRSEVDKANDILEVFERKCQKDATVVGLEELANLLQDEM